ncbi:MAG: DNRLRE domain-containing protein, partial [Chloroflexota bacterium]|nr:DNRLRE domain-containing protein [Chloroflexota bacterium]
MSSQLTLLHRWAAVVIVAIVALLASMLPAAHVQASPGLEPDVATTVELIAVQDARIQAGSPDVGFENGLLWVGTANGHLTLLQFDLSVLPVNATIDAAELRLYFTGFYSGTNTVEVGRVDGDWNDVDLTWNTQPPLTWGGPQQPIGDSAGDIRWNVTPLAAQWHSGAVANEGFALRGSGGPLKGFRSSENPPATAPRLVITYHTPPETGPRPDLGDAPDSTNHHGINNTAYAGAGILGQFPTVRDVPVGQPAGPRHSNETGEGILGQFLSREAEADVGPDQDGPNNILRNAAGAVGDVADNDRGDDGWRNRNIKFFNCERQTLTVRVSKAPTATLDEMYLNVWFDGNRDGEWDDNALCNPPDGGAAIPATEWIVQDFSVNMAAIAPGGFVDINVNTEIVLNTTPGEPHWMRFMLSEERAVQTPGGRADGRGPHPAGALGAYRFGETEDVLQKPSPLGEMGELVLEKSVDTHTSPVLFGGMVTYEILLRHNGGSGPVQAAIRDELPYPLHIHPRIVNGVPQWVVVESSTGGAGPLLAGLDTKTNPPPAPPSQVIKWQGTLAPNSEIKLTFDVHVLPLCGPNQQTESIRNLAEARAQGGNLITDEVSFNAACPSYDGIIVTQHVITGTLDSLIDWHDLPLEAEVTNNGLFTATLGLFNSLSTNGAAAAGVAADNSRFVERVTLAPGETQRVDLSLRMKNELTDELTLPADYAVVSNLAFCILPGGEEYGDNTCPDAGQYPQLHGNAQPITFTVRPNDLGDAPDSTNHAGVAMAAYAGVQANFPTVFDPTTGLPEGPLHLHPRPFHLGPNVTREAEADIGPDADGVNNIEPGAGANLDGADDGSRLSNLADCQSATAEALIDISPGAVNWFSEHDADKLAYLNVWIDSNRDGDWDDGFTCQPPGAQQIDVVEHILIDQPIDVVTLGAGLHPLSFQTKPVRWPAQLAQNPTWVRFTLSEIPSNKTLQFGAINYGDGRGYPVPFQTGETEDKLLQPQGGDNDGPDLAVQLAGRIAQSGDSVQFKLEIANQGVQPASGATLTFQKPPQLRDLEIVLLQAPGIPPANIVNSGETIQFTLPTIEPDNIIAILIGLALPADDGNSKAYAASATVNLASDTDPSNNGASVTVDNPLPTPIIGVLMDYTDAALLDYLAGGRAATCQANPT